MPFIDFQIGDHAPKRGDLVQSNVEHRGNGRERTWFVLEPEMRMRLFRSAERAGEQRVIVFHRYPAKRRQTIEDIYGLPSVNQRKRR